MKHTQKTLRVLCLSHCVLCGGTAWAGAATSAPVDIEDAPAPEFAAEGNETKAVRSGPLVIERGERWAPLEIRREPAPGSALDFSGMGLQDAPAGKHGWLKNVGGHFEFEGLPGVEQRFYGANICSAANFPDHATADRLVAALVRRGYNSVRIHHTDKVWKEASASRMVERSDGQTVERSDRQTVGPSDRQTVDVIDRLDYLLARLYAAGIYVTTDLFMSRNVMWRDIGIDRDGRMSNKALYKTYVGIHDGAFADWCFWARDFLEHVNPYTGRANKDEPGMPFISLVNESRLHNGWNWKKDDPVVLAAWREFSGSDSPPPLCDVGSVDPDDPFNQFDDWINRRMWERCSSFVRSLGCRALLTNDNNGRRHGEGQDCTPLYDYVDSHSYVYVPKWQGDRQKGAPLVCRQINPVRHSLPNILFLSGWAKGASKPHTISEWNLCAPGRCRAATGLIYGALAADGGFDALWRFAYAHQSDILVDPPGGRGTIQSPLYDIAANPDMLAEDYAAVCLFLRRDVPQENEECKTKNAKLEDAPAIRIDRERGAMAVATPRTCGGFAESGRIDAGVLSFEIAGRDGPALQDNSATNHSSLVTRHSSLRGGHSVPTALWASSLDGAPLSTSSRILLVHLTDVQREDAVFSDDTFGVMLTPGTAPLIEAGTAEVELRLSIGGSGAQPPSFVVFSLDTAGNRTGEVPATFSDGALRFTVSTMAPDGTGRIYYEVVRDDTVPEFQP